jgi:hypothetical protein
LQSEQIKDATARQAPQKIKIKIKGSINKYHYAFVNFAFNVSHANNHLFPSVCMLATNKSCHPDPAPKIHHASNALVICSKINLAILPPIHLKRQAVEGFCKQKVGIRRSVVKWARRCFEPVFRGPKASAASLAPVMSLRACSQSG